MNLGLGILHPGSWSFVDLGFGSLIPSTTKGLESKITGFVNVPVKNLFLTTTNRQTCL